MKRYGSNGEPNTPVSGRKPTYPDRLLELLRTAVLAVEVVQVAWHVAFIRHRVRGWRHPHLREPTPHRRRSEAIECRHKLRQVTHTLRPCPAPDRDVARLSTVKHAQPCSVQLKEPLRIQPIHLYMEPRGSVRWRPYETQPGAIPYLRLE